MLHSILHSIVRCGDKIAHSVAFKCLDGFECGAALVQQEIHNFAKILVYQCSGVDQQL